MRKSLIFLMIFLQLFNLIGEEVMKNEEGNSAVAVQNTSEIQPESVRKKEGVKTIYIQPTFGMELAFLNNVAPKFSLDVEFLLKNTNVYLGFDMALIYFPHNVFVGYNYLAGDWSVPVHLNVVFAFLPYYERSPLKSLELFLASGVDFCFLQHGDSYHDVKGAFYYYQYSRSKNLVDYKFFAIFPSFNIGMNFLFEYNVVFEIGLDYTLFYYLGIYTNLGYRF